MALAITIVALLLAGVLCYSAWRSLLNPGMLMLLAWSPALLLVSLDVHFLTAEYDVLNHGVNPFAYIIFALAFFFFCIGGMVGRASIYKSAGGGVRYSEMRYISVKEHLLAGLFLFGFCVFIYAFSQSGLAGQLQASPDDVLASREAFHVGFINHFVLLMDVVSIVFFGKFMESRRLRYALPAMITMLCYMATLQKSRVLFIFFSVAFMALLYRRQARSLLWGTFGRKFATISACALVALALLITNAIRGMGENKYTDLESPVLEQLYIYSGAPALLNFSGTLTGAIPSDPPSLGRLLFRTALWEVADRDTLNPTRYFEGINNGTALIFYWQDFRLLGAVLIPFLVGMLISIGFAAAANRSVVGLVAGCIAFDAVLLSIYTDVMFEPSSVVILILAVITDVVSRKPRQQAWREPRAGTTASVSDGVG